MPSAAVEPLGPGDRADVEGHGWLAVDRMVRSAAHVAPDAAAQLATGARQRHAGMRELAQHLHDVGELRADLTPDEAADRIDVLTAPEVYRLTTGNHGWTQPQYERWLCELLVASLLPARKGRSRQQ
jgi:hypothetical protein